MLGAIAASYVDAASSGLTFTSYSAACGVSGSTSIAVPLPSGSGGILLALTSDGSATTSGNFNTPAGWVLGATASGAAAFHRVADGTEGSTVTFTKAGSSGVFLVSIIRVNGQNALTPVAAVGCTATPGTGGSGTLTTSALAATTAGSLLLEQFNVNDTSTTTNGTPPAGITERYDDIVPVGSSRRHVIAGDRIVAAGAIASESWTWSSGSPQWRGVTWVINP